MLWGPPSKSCHTPKRPFSLQQPFKGSPTSNLSGHPGVDRLKGQTGRGEGTPSESQEGPFPAGLQVQVSHEPKVSFWP